MPVVLRRHAAVRAGRRRRPESTSTSCTGPSSSIPGCRWATARSLLDYLERKFGDRSRVQAAHARLTSAGAELGIDFRWSGMRRANTFDAHRLLAWALHDHGADKQRALKQRLLHAYFTDGLDVADHEVLAALAG